MTSSIVRFFNPVGIPHFAPNVTSRVICSASPKEGPNDTPAGGSETVDPSVLETQEKSARMQEMIEALSFPSGTRIPRRFSGIGNEQPGGSEGPKKEISWSEDFKIDLKEPQVEVRMDIEAWTACFKQNSKELGYDSIEISPIYIDVDGTYVDFKPKVSYVGTNEIHFHIDSDQFPQTSDKYGKSSFDFKSIRDFWRWFKNRITAECLKNGTVTLLQDEDRYHLHLVVKNIEDDDSASFGQQLQKLKTAIQIFTEVFLKSLKHEKNEVLEIKNPKIRTRPQRQGFMEMMFGTSPGGAAVEKVKGLEVTDVQLRLEDMGGNIELKEQIRRLVAQYKNPEFFEARGVKLPKGILLYGPPGTGKTLSAKIFAGEIGRRFYHVKASDILSKYYGESEQTIRDIFKHVEGPCIIFIDEIDSIGEHREGASEPTRRVLSELLQQLDGMTSRQDIILLAATNRKESLDPALLRPGRFDRHILVDRPDEASRKQIWQIHLKKQTANAQVSLFADNLNIDQLSRESDGLVGADIEEIVRYTKEKAVFAAFDSQKDILITTGMLSDEIKAYKSEREKERKHHQRPGFRQ